MAKTNMPQAIIDQTIRETRRASLIQVSEVSKAFGKEPVLREIDLEVGEHELVAVVGRSGCGKSTLLRLLAGIETAFEGEIVVAGLFSFFQALRARLPSF
jgi:ABC-type Fe3+/spermidine/putrescine transport system ATPase subunit